jgi:hypothetical protein
MLLFMLDGYANALEIAADDNSAYQQLIAALARVDLEEANRQSEEFYMQLLLKGGGATAALNWKRAWDAALAEASKNSGD